MTSSFTMPADENLVSEWQSGEGQLSELTPKIVTALGLLAASAASSEQVTVWLHGEMGMGKTTLVGHLLRAIGLPDGYPVTSPTFSLVNEYDIRGRHFAHLDLYRLAAHGEAAPARAAGGIDEGLLEHRFFSGVFIEWPTAVADLDYIFPASHHLKISTAEKGGRLYQLFTAGS